MLASRISPPSSTPRLSSVISLSSRCARRADRQQSQIADAAPVGGIRAEAELGETRQLEVLVTDRGPVSVEVVTHLVVFAVRVAQKCVEGEHVSNQRRCLEFDRRDGGVCGIGGDLHAADSDVRTRHLALHPVDPVWKAARFKRTRRSVSGLVVQMGVRTSSMSMREMASTVMSPKLARA